MKKTEYILLVSSGVANGEKYRRVWQDENGDCFIKYNGETRNVNHCKELFIREENEQ